MPPFWVEAVSTSVAVVTACAALPMAPSDSRLVDQAVTLVFAGLAEVMLPFWLLMIARRWLTLSLLPVVISPRATPPLTSVTSTWPFFALAFSTSASTFSATPSAPMEAPSLVTSRFRVPARVLLPSAVRMLSLAVRLTVPAAALIWPACSISAALMVSEVASITPVLFTTEDIRSLAVLPCSRTFCALISPLLSTPTLALPVAEPN
ncbi:hypothetical protein D9M69_150270 [compost metagenome]